MQTVFGEVNELSKRIMQSINGNSIRLMDSNCEDEDLIDAMNNIIQAITLMVNFIELIYNSSQFPEIVSLLNQKKRLQLEILKMRKIILIIQSQKKFGDDFDRASFNF